MGMWNACLVEHLQLRLLKLLLHLRKSTPNCMVYGESGRFEFDILTIKHAVLYWYKCVTDCGMKWSVHMNCIMYALYVLRSMQLPWITYIYKICSNWGLNYVWVLEGRGTIVTMLKVLVHQVSLDQFIQKWRSQDNSASKCLCYRI